jgi:hypothetical protein
MAGSPRSDSPDDAANPHLLAPPWRAFVGRFALAHFIAYPVAMVTAIGATPVALWLHKRSMLHANATAVRWQTVREVLEKYRLSATEASLVGVVLDFVIFATLGTFALIHFAAIPWALSGAHAETPGRKRTGAFRLFVAVTAATLVLTALSGAAGWLWLFLQ